MNPTALTVNCVLPLTKAGRGGRTVRRPEPLPDTPPVDPDAGKVPRVARLMALAIHFDDLLRQGLARDQADLARLGQVTQARMSQIMSLLNLAPDIHPMAFGPDHQPNGAPAQNEVGAVVHGQRSRATDRFQVFGRGWFPEG